MGKKCVKCGYQRLASEATPDYECPKCGAIYAKVEAAMNKVEQQVAGVPLQNDFANYDKYAKCTYIKDWKGICEINGLSFDSFGTKKELKVLQDYLESDEVVFAFSSGIMSQTQTSNAFDWGNNTWLVVLTNERFLFLDHAMLSRSVDTQSVRHDSVQAVSASQGVMLGKIQVDLGARVIIIDNCQKSSVKVIANLANKWLRILHKINNNSGNISKESFSHLQESIELSQIQIVNQEKIISLLEEILENIARQ